MDRDATTPVLVGVSQVLQRAADYEQAREPLELMIDAVRAAADDAGSRELLARAQVMRVIRGAWRYEDPGRVVADAIGAIGARTALTIYGGNVVQAVVNRTCRDIAQGGLDVAVLTGAECGQSRARARKAGARVQWSDAPGKPDESLGEDEMMRHPAEVARKIVAPIQIYPIFENALRRTRGESLDAHIRRISELWAGFSAVASGNPSAWIRDPVDAETIRTPGPANRMISFPYPKLMNSNSAVDMGAALILTSLAVARRLGIDESRLVYPHVGTEAHDHITVSERQDLHSSPAIRFAGRRALELAGVGVADVKHFDVYSCFPSAVQVAAAELGLPDDRPWTVTGGLTFGGGPLNNYVMHGVARMAEVLRDDPGSTGMCTANGGYLTKHALGVYSTAPPERPFQYADLQAEVDRTPRREVAEEASGEIEIESYTVMYGAAGAEVGHVACLLPDGRRAWGNVTDRDAAAAMARDEYGGRRAQLDDDGVVTLQ